MDRLLLAIDNNKVKLFIKLGKKIQKLRKQIDLTQEEFAEELNISRTHIGHIEQGRKKPSLKLLQKISKKVGVRVKDLIPF